MIGDVVRAWRALGAETDDERRAIARLLGFDLRADEVVTTAARPPMSPPTASVPTPRVEAPRVEAAADPEAIPLELVTFPPVRDDDPRLPLDGLDRPTAAVAAPLESLFAAGWSRTIAAKLTARAAATGAIDVARLIDRFAHRRPVLALPRQQRLITATEIVIVVDQRGTLAWFEPDVAALVAQINAVTPAHVSVVPSAGAPTLIAANVEAVTNDDDDDDPPAAVRLAEHGRLIAITDLGLGSPWTRADLRRADAWATLATELAARGSTLVIVTPVDPAALPSQVTRAAACVHWDRATGPALVHRLVKALG